MNIIRYMYVLIGNLIPFWVQHWAYSLLTLQFRGGARNHAPYSPDPTKKDNRKSTSEERKRDQRRWHRWRRVDCNARARRTKTVRRRIITHLGDSAFLAGSYIHFWRLLVEMLPVGTLHFPRSPLVIKLTIHAYFLLSLPCP